ncbi:hypothetical protein PPROV_000387300 [Pycnococcus provasolii]|uniref:Type-4 uracil-DNA glycosylase n=1 Tax=Pycnococcus provasolii TaxID=41880 RepID=A0A830HHL5_9CHLO|nr:hypothetical protein PPROV_000387300 [Pycnococcus provasolii]
MWRVRTWRLVTTTTTCSRRRGVTPRVRTCASNSGAELEELHARIASLDNDPACDDPNAGRRIVVYRGSTNAKLMIVGEAPGANEDQLGKPFVGRSGQLLDQILSAASINPEDTYVTNVVKRRPPDNRDPTPDEIKFWRPLLLDQIRALKPAIILLVGRIAMSTLALDTDTEKRITYLRGRWLKPREDVATYDEDAFEPGAVTPPDSCSPALMAIFHPAYLLRNQSKEAGSPKALTWRDIRVVRHALHIRAPEMYPNEGPMLAPDDRT